MKTFILALLLLMSPGVKFDKTVHDFGRISVKDGEQTCTFTLSNNSEEPVTILAVVSSCGCTGVQWTRESIAKGGQGTVTATYSNNEGPYPFDKVLTVYLSNEKKPVVLHIKGEVTKK